MINEMGGFIELDTYNLPMLHEKAIKLNCGRNALRYLVKSRNIKKMYMPMFLCASCIEALVDENVEIEYYSIGKDFKPIEVNLVGCEWLYVVNYYGQISNKYIRGLKKKYSNIIVDNAQAYFQQPVEHVDTIYTCRKFFGVADGAVLYTDNILECELEVDESYDRMRFLLGRFERRASEFYREYVLNNDRFFGEPIKEMSKLTSNLLHGIDYEFVRKKRRDNFIILQEAFRNINQLNIKLPYGPFMYPLYIKNGCELRHRLLEKNIYIPILWPDVFEVCTHDELEYDMANNIVPLPVDQRYGESDMKYLISEVLKCLD